MSMSIFSSSKASWPNQGAVSALKYFPKPRVAWKPHQFSRENLADADLTKLWHRGRIGSGRDLNNYFSPESTQSRYEFEVKKIPRHEMEKFMPNIDIGPKSLVTPTSLMSVRDGHKVTHDLVMSYDQHTNTRRDGDVSRLDHDNVTPLDPKHVGIHGDTMGCRAKIYRWMRRGPQNNEFNMMNRDILKMQSPTAKQGAEMELPLYKKIIRLAKKGKFKSACEEYRRCTYIPPVHVYRALLAACVPGGEIAEAVAIYTDADKLHGMTRDTECFMSLMNCAIAAGNVPRVIWVINEMQGEFFRSDIMRTRVEPIWVHQIALKGLEFLLDAEQLMEARTVYGFLASQSNATSAHQGGGVGNCGNGAALQHLLPGDLDFRTGLDTDLHIRQGADVRAMLEAGKKVDLSSLSMADVTLEKAVDQVMGHVAQVALGMLPAHVRAQVAAQGRVGDADWLVSYYSDIDVRSILRLARFVRGGADLLASDAEEYSIRAANWLELLSQANLKNGKPLPYLFKTKPSSVNPNVRIVGPPNWEESEKIGMPPMNAVGAQPGTVASGFLTPTDGGYTFDYRQGMRTVVETLPAQGYRAGRLLPRPFLQTEVENSTKFDSSTPKAAQVSDELEGGDSGLVGTDASTGLAGVAGGAGFLAGVESQQNSIFHSSVLQGEGQEEPPTMSNQDSPPAVSNDASASASNEAAPAIDSARF